ncbi:MAG: molybdate ABC transporter substrate-binding protein [Anaerolineae bacterium]|nr:molybdate ABC transporter substrate-binding protein [Anaerolineae bacterium]NUQ05774.1 molybdate ABC transporter substrate-binding protein [Anaerolineae bacterium]
MRVIRALFASLAGCIALLALVFAGHAEERHTLVVFAAASLTDAFEEIAAAFTAAHPGVEVLFSFGGSSELAAQISEGAPADVFASANARQMQAAVDAGRIAMEPQTFAHNRLVLIVPVDNPAGITSLDDLANDGVALVAAAAGVPVRDYTDSLLERLAADPAYGEAYRAAVLSHIVSEENNARQVAAKVALGEADAGIVYQSDITPDLREEVIAITIPDALNTLASYPIAAISDSETPELAAAFVDYVLSDAGQEALARWNFIPVRALDPEATPEADCAPVESEPVCAPPAVGEGEGGGIGIGAPILGG